MGSGSENRYHLQPTAASRHAIPIDAWATYIRRGGEPAAQGASLQIVPDVRAESNPWTGRAA